MEYKDYYKTLDVSRNASQDEIKRAYRKYARKYHPDVSKEPKAEQRFKEIGEAYEVLKDPQKRAAYDQLGTHWRAGEEFRPPPGWNSSFDFGGGGFNARFDFSDLFEGLFTGGRTQNRRHTRHSQFRSTNGEDQHSKIAISLEDAYQGTTRTIQVQMPEMDGNGRIVTKTRTLNVKVPQGIVQGKKIRLSGQGTTGMGSGINGDLYLEIEFKPHRLYRAEGRDIYLTLPITPWEAALGSTVAVPTLGGRVDMKIPAGSQSGQKLRLKSRGFPGSPPGEHYVVLQIVTPKANTEAARAFYRKMAQELPLEPRADMR
ncbi:MAG: J domain-containing protein [Candidatus Parabeggiatoa sp. nov. 1]|nr:MAG: J domain-containing protein [Gammaproteobacteria bacterium]